MFPVYHISRDGTAQGFAPSMPAPVLRRNPIKLADALPPYRKPLPSAQVML